MIHLQQQATPKCDIVAGLCLALARNLKSNLGCGRKFKRPVVFTGGVAANLGVVRAIEEALELPHDGLIVPDEKFFTGAIGAVGFRETTKTKAYQNPLDIESLADYLTSDGCFTCQRSEVRQQLSLPGCPHPKSRVYEELLSLRRRHPLKHIWVLTSGR